MSHLDVVPAPPEGWTHDPFAADVEDGWIYGRGAVDMKDLLAMQLEVMRLLAEEARAAGRDPASDPVPGLRRDVLFASVADEEAGGLAGAAYLALEEPDTVRAAAAINEAGGVAVDIGSRRLYPIQVAEKGMTVFRLTFNGIWGHGSMPRDENAIRLATDAVARLAPPWPTRLTDVTRSLLERTIEAFDGSDDLPPDAIRLLRAALSGRSAGLGARAVRHLPAGLHAGPRRDAPRHPVAEHPPGRREVQHHPRHCQPRGRRPPPAGVQRGGHGGPDSRAARAGALGA